jgi:hypothetical protein
MNHHVGWPEYATTAIEKKMMKEKKKGKKRERWFEYVSVL